MPRYLDTRGNSKIGIGICARCNCKYPIVDLSPDPNYPGLYCCPDGCLDDFDPWRLPARQADDLTLDHPRPDVPLAPGPYSSGLPPITDVPQVMTDQVGNVLITETGDVVVTGATGTVTVATLTPSKPWGANGGYAVGQQVTPINPVGMAAVGLVIKEFACIVAGTSGSVAPEWTSDIGTMVVDGSVIWINTGLYLP